MRALLLILASGTAALPWSGEEYFEGFDAPGRPPDRRGITWDFKAELSPADWKDLVPGDGYAHLSVIRSALKEENSSEPGHWPFQTLLLESVVPNTRISIRAKNSAIPGVAGMLFTYLDKDTLEEIDIEIAAADTQEPFTAHRTDLGGGWTDVRLNTWVNLKPDTLLPTKGIRTPIKDADGRKVSHRDGLFHIYTIEWRSSGITFFIDGVPQASIDSAPQSPAAVIFGLRQLPWAGTPDWTGRQTMLVDWIVLEPLE